MPKLNVGDVVKVRSDLTTAQYGSNSAVNSMVTFRNKYVTIAEITPFNEYHIKEDIEDWNWTDEMFDGVIEEKLKGIAFAILQEFEDLLQDYNMKIPDTCRAEEDNEACLFGENYYLLEDKIVEILKQNV